MNDTDKVVIVVDIKTRKPACVLLQAVYGSDERAGRVVSTFFDSRHWIVNPDDQTQFRKVEGTIGQWRGLAEQLDNQTNRKDRHEQETTE